MRRLTNPRTGIEQGETEVFSDFETGGAMWTSEGARERRKAVRFREAFRTPPAVHLSISLWDMDTSAAIRAHILAENVTCEGFDIVFRTWADSRVARLRASWLAVGELPFGDDWDIT